LEKEEATKHQIDEIYTQYPFYGSRRITVVLRREMVIHRKTVQRYMRNMGIAGICPGPKLSKRNLEHQIYPYLLRNVTSSYPNHVWGIDITYIRPVGIFTNQVFVVWMNKCIMIIDVEPFSKAFWASSPEEAIRIAREILEQGTWVEGPAIVKQSEEERMRTMGAPELPGFAPVQKKRKS
jgi:hypothetical protein